MTTPENTDATQVEEYMQEERAREESVIKIQEAARKHLHEKRKREKKLREQELRESAENCVIM